MPTEDQLSPLSSAFLGRVRTGISSVLDLSQTSDWMIKNTAHPKDELLPMSFDKHEFQIDIVNDSAPRVLVRKCSQVGLSELTVRLLLSLLGRLRNHTAIYTLPTEAFATNFSRTRIDPVIEASNALSHLIDNDINNSELKKIGSNFLYIKGTFTQKAAISVPADILIQDEVDFSDQVVLSTYSSRLGHADNGGIRREFSTPTVNGFGISKGYATSSQARYMVKCDSCSLWVAPDFWNDVVIPGFDKQIEKFEKDDLLNPLYKIDKAYLKCPSCSQPLKQSNLCSPESRQWVHEFDREVHGYQVMPFDAPAINPIPKTLKFIEDYEKKADWVNFKVGLPFEDAENSFVLETIDNNTVVDPVKPPDLEMQDDVSVMDHVSGLVMGTDVGKVSNIIIGAPRGQNAFDVIWAERVRQTGEGVLLKRLIFLTKWFGVEKSVIDAGPDFSTAMAYVAAFKLGRVFANYYLTNRSKKRLEHITIDLEEGVCNSVRTDSFDTLASRVNNSRVRFAKTPETSLIKEHLLALKRVEKLNLQGEKVASWVSDGQDHYGHALNYTNIAFHLSDAKYLPPVKVGVLPMATKVRVKQA